jgi:hypothetical protein
MHASVNNPRYLTNTCTVQSLKVSAEMGSEQKPDAGKRTDRQTASVPL